MTKEEEWWLDTHGGRNETDVYLFRHKKYVWMKCRGGKERVFIPSKETLSEMYAKRIYPNVLLNQ